MDFSFKKLFKKESTLSVNDQLTDFINNAGQVGVSFKLAQDIFSETKLSIHQEKARCKKAYNNNSYVNQGVNELVNAMEGENPEIKCENEILHKFGEKWEHFTGWKRSRKEAIQEAIITGDGYIKKLKGNKGSIKYQHIENSEDMYIEWDYRNNQPLRFIQRLWFTEAQAKKRGIKQFTLQTPYGVETIFGIEHTPDTIIRFKFHNHSFGIYGRGAPSSILNDIEIINKIERSIAVISMFKAIPQKILTPKQTSQDKPAVWTPKQIELIGEQLKSQKDFESSIIGTPMEALNVTDAGQIIELNGYLDYFKRKISRALSPEYIAHGDIVNRSVGDNQKQVYYLSVLAIRDYFIDDIETSLQEGMNASLNVLKDKGIKIPEATFYFEFGNYDPETREQKIQRLMAEWDRGLITHSEYRELTGYEPDDNLKNSYRFDLMSSQPEQQINDVKDIVNGQDKKTDRVDEKK
jgi:hypothetical protein